MFVTQKSYSLHNADFESFLLTFTLPLYILLANVFTTLL